LNCALSLENNKPIQKHDGDRAECGFRPSPLIVAVRGALIGLGLASLVLPQIVIAESNIAAQASAVTYSIPAGAMADALNRFAQQAGVSISFAAADVKDVTTKGLNGRFSVQEGLEVGASFGG
jgi:catecholate siderophore receptor